MDERELCKNCEEVPARDGSYFCGRKCSLAYAAAARAGEVPRLEPRPKHASPQQAAVAADHAWTLLRKGFTYQQIASRLDRAPSTVKSLLWRTRPPRAEPTPLQQRIAERLKQTPQAPNMQIARDLGVSRITVSMVRRHLGIAPVPVGRHPNARSTRP